MVFSLDPGPLHRPLGVAFGGGTTALGGAGWIGVERHAGSASGAATAALVPPPDVADAAARFTSAQLRRSGGRARGVLVTSWPLDEGTSGPTAFAAAEAAGIPAEQVLLVDRAAPASASTNATLTARDCAPLVAATAEDALVPFLAALGAPVRGGVASARGIVDGQRVSLLALAGALPLPAQPQPLRFVLLTDAALAPAPLDALLRDVVAATFGGVAGLRTPRPDDALIALATGLAGTEPLSPDGLGFRTLRAGALTIVQSLVQQLLEAALPAGRGGAVVQLSIHGAVDDAAATQLAEALAADPAAREALAAALKADAPDEARGPAAPFDSDDRALAAAFAAVVRAHGGEAPRLRLARARHGRMAALQVNVAAPIATPRGGGTATRWTVVGERP